MFANSEDEIVRKVRAVGADVVILHARPGGSDVFWAVSRVRKARDLAAVACLVVYPASMAKLVEGHRLLAHPADAYVPELAAPESLAQAVPAALMQRASPEGPATARRRLASLPGFVRALGMWLLLGCLVLADLAPRFGHQVAPIELVAWVAFTTGSGLELAFSRGRGPLRWIALFLGLAALGGRLFAGRGS